MRQKERPSNRKQKNSITVSSDHLIAIACESDRDWFQEHADETTRIRPAVLGEIPGLGSTEEPTQVIVEQISPGIRLRRGITVYKYAPLIRDLDAAVESLQRLAPAEDFPEPIVFLDPDGRKL